MEQLFRPLLLLPQLIRPLFHDLFQVGGIFFQHRDHVVENVGLSVISRKRIKV